MRQLRSGFLCVSAALTLVGLAVVASRFVPGLDVLLPAPDGYVREQWRKAQLLEDSAGLNQVSADKHAVVADVIAGRAGLVEAARRFRALDAAAPQFNRDAFCRAWPGRTDEERYCREVMAFVRATLREEPDRAQLVMGRLDAELGDYLRRREPTLVAGTTGHGRAAIRIP